MKTFTSQILALLFLAVAAPANADAWQQRIPVGMPPEKYTGHSAVWTGQEMLVWGGVGIGYSNSGGRYNPTTNTWTSTSTTGAPSPRAYHLSVWTGSEMIVSGGIGSGTSFKNGGRYRPETDTWAAMSATGFPSATTDGTAVWTGTEMIIWGGSVGGGSVTNSGARYNPATDSWTAVPLTGAPAARMWHKAVWTGSEMIVWGGVPNTSPGGIPLATGGRYNPATNSWVAMSNTAAPVARRFHTAVWTGADMVVWGGDTGGNNMVFLNTGGRYNPAANTWMPTSLANAPAGRNQHTAVWTGNEMIVWGEWGGGTRPSSGGRYLPQTNVWTPTTIFGAPPPRTEHSALWDGREMLVWGGIGGRAHIYSYTPECGDFRITSVFVDGENLILSFPTLTGRTYTLRVSDTLASGPWINTGLPAVTGTGATQTFSVPVTAASRRFFRVQSDP